MNQLTFESSGIKFQVNNIEDSLRGFYISQKVDPSSDSEVVFYLKNKMQYYHVSHCDSIAEERPILEMAFIMELAEHFYFIKGDLSNKRINTPLSMLLLT